MVHTGSAAVEAPVENQRTFGKDGRERVRKVPRKGVGGPSLCSQCVRTLPTRESRLNSSAVSSLTTSTKVAFLPSTTVMPFTFGMSLLRPQSGH